MDLVTPDFGLIFWTLVTFLLLVFLLSKFAWKPILKMVNDREASIEDALKAAERARDEMKSLQADNEAVLKEAREERERILKEAREMKNKIVSDAKDIAIAEGEKAIASAKAAIAAEKASAIAALKNQAAVLSIEIAEKVLGNELSAENKQAEMISKMIDEVKFN
jgi:F-type H+-transporting ATPase subunit b